MFVFTTQPRRAKFGYDILDRLTLANKISPQWSRMIEEVLRFFNHHLTELYDKVRPNIVVINDGDIWDAETTIANLVYPILLKLKKEKHGAPNVDPIDVPEHLRMTVEQRKAYELDGTTDKNYFARYDYIMDEMLFAFKYVKDGKQFEFGNFDRKEYARVENGLQLFAKYYFSLWD